MNNPNSWFQFALYVGALLLVTKPLGLYLVQVLDARGRTWLDPVVRPVERLTYRLCGINAENVGSVLDAGATRIAVSHAILSAHDPEAAAKALHGRVVSGES